MIMYDVECLWCACVRALTGILSR